jgi:ubiquinone/menaquinone biosynthesis C-methylase UbiE
VDQTRLRTPDPYGRTFQMDDQTLAAIAARLEARGKHPFFARVIGDYMDALGLSGPEAILDLGCGTGVAARAIARRPEAKGPAITAIDISAHLVELGRKLADGEGLAGRIDFRVGDAHGLGLPEGGFDAVVMHTLVSHVADPATVLAEGRRLLRPGGRLVVFDGDYASFTMATDAPDGGAETDHVLHGALFAELRVMRAMPRLLAEGGFGLEWSRAYVMADIGRAEFWAPTIASLRVLLPKAGAMPEAEAAAFADALERSSAQGRFFAASNFYTYLARRDG